MLQERGRQDAELLALSPPILNIFLLEEQPPPPPVLVGWEHPDGKAERSSPPSAPEGPVVVGWERPNAG